MTVVEILLESAQHAQRPEALVATQWPAECSMQRFALACSGKRYEQWAAVASSASSGASSGQQRPAAERSDLPSPAAASSLAQQWSCLDAQRARETSARRTSCHGAVGVLLSQ
jgi:hypothetical protein